MSDPDVAAYVDRLLHGPLAEPATPATAPARPHREIATEWREGEVHRIYRWFDADGILLYVGVTVDIHYRTSAHRPRFWMRFAARVECDDDGFADREESEAAELRAIHDERPIFNVVGQTKGYRERRVDYVLAHRTQLAHDN